MIFCAFNGLNIKKQPIFIHLRLTMYKKAAFLYIVSRRCKKICRLGIPKTVYRFSANFRTCVPEPK